jgi:carboxyl-terminal processing protease
VNKKRFIHGAIINTIISFALVNAFNINAFAAPYGQDVLTIGKQIIKEYYIEDVPASKLDAAKDINSLVESLNDPYSNYFTASEYEEFVNSVNNSFAGIGVQIEVALEGIELVAVYDNSPAQNAGLQVGDIITEADGKALAGMSSEQAVSYVRGPVDSTASLKIKRGENTLSFKVTRKLIELPTVAGGIIDNHIGYIRIASFGEDTSYEFNNKLVELKSKAVDSYIIDLRYNPGGYIDAATNIAGNFIGGNVALRAYEKSGDSNVFYATSQQEKVEKPTIFLINEYSASASEILAAAIKDNQKAVFIGEKTYGKGVAQSMFSLPDNSYIKLTTFRFVSPLGNEINKVGVSPHVIIKDDLEKGIDSLAAAEILFSGLNSGTDKSDFIKVNLAGKDFEVNLNTAVSKNNIDTFKYMTSNLFNNDNFFVGGKDGFDKLQESRSASSYLFPSVDSIYSSAYIATAAAMNQMTQKAINEARTAISKLPKELDWAVGEFSKQVDIVQHPFLLKIVQAIEKSQASNKQEDINAAKAAIDPELPFEWRSSYSSAVDKVQQKLMKDALEAYETAINSKDNHDIENAVSKFLEIKASQDSGVSKWAENFYLEIQVIGQ